MIKSLQKFINLSFDEKRITIHAFFTLVVIKLTLSRLQFHKVLSYYNRPINTPSKQLSDGQFETQVALAVNRVADRIPNTHCLPRALAVKKILAQYGYASELHIGTLKSSSGEFAAHAWVEKNDTIIIGDIENLSTFSRFPIQMESKV